jgi:hypothetical protein
LESLPETFLLGRQRISAGLSQTFVKRYRCSDFLCVFLCYGVAVGSLDESGPIFISKTKRRKEK